MDDVMSLTTLDHDAPIDDVETADPDVDVDDVALTAPAPPPRRQAAEAKADNGGSWWVKKTRAELNEQAEKRASDNSRKAGKHASLGPYAW